MQLKVFTVDAFTKTAFSGNPAAIIPLDQELPGETLQKIANEINLSETAYLIRSSPDKSWVEESRFGLRWFTPTNEVILCGHATLASSHALFSCIGNTSKCLEFDTLSGRLLARRNEDDSIILDFPNNEPKPLTQEERDQLNPIVDVVKEACLSVVDVQVSLSAKKLLVRLDDHTPREKFEGFQPDNRLLLSLHDGSTIKGLILTKKGGAESGGDYAQYHCVSRYFAVWNGIPEDPVTGSAHTVLGPYWGSKLDLQQLKCRQCSARGGDVTVEVRKDGRVDLSGHAVTVISGHVNF